MPSIEQPDRPVRLREVRTYVAKCHNWRLGLRPFNRLMRPDGTVYTVPGLTVEFNNGEYKTANAEIQDALESSPHLGEQFWRADKPRPATAPAPRPEVITAQPPQTPAEPIHSEADAADLDDHTCGVCGKYYTTPNWLARHMKEKHGEGSQEPETARS